MEEILTDKSIWKKTGEELTVKDQVKLITGYTVLSMAIPFVVLGAVVGVSKVTEKIQERRAQKKADKANNIIAVK